MSSDIPTTTPPAGPAAKAPKAAKPPSAVRVLPHPDLCPEGLSVDGHIGQKLVDAMLKAGIEIEHACEKVGACATCHVYILSLIHI
jgi:2Fe-2S ferredoxin